MEQTYSNSLNIPAEKETSLGEDFVWRRQLVDGIIPLMDGLSIPPYYQGRILKYIDSLPTIEKDSVYLYDTTIALEEALKKIEENAYPVYQKNNGVESGMTLSGIRQVFDEIKEQLFKDTEKPSEQEMER